MQHRGERGAQVIEFAIILPLFLAILAGIMEFGFIFFRQQMLTNAAREGARAGIIQAVPKPTDTEITSVVKGYLANTGIDTSKVTVSFPIGGVQGAFGTDLTVKASYPHTYLMLNAFIGSSSLTLNAQATMRNE